MGTAERKVLIVFVYYIFLSVVSLLTYSQSTRNGEHKIEELLSYFVCERRGVDPDHPCDTSGYKNYIVSVVLSTISFILIGLYSLLNFIYVVDFRDFKNLLKRQPQSIKKCFKCQKYSVSGNQNAKAGACIIF